MKEKVKETTVPVTMYLDYIKDGTISDDQDVQRVFCSDNSFINGIGVTVLTEDYLPPIILCSVPYEDGTSQIYIADGCQRTAALMLIQSGHHKFTSSIEDSVIEYQSQKKNKDGSVCKDDYGRIVWEIKSFDIRNKTFNDFPKELKDRFNRFQLKIATHPECTMEEVSKYVRRYNNHKSMNTSQKAFTYIDKYARAVKNITRSTGFFKNCMRISNTERRNGTYERLVCEGVMSVFHLEDWKKAPKQMSIYLNENSSNEEFNYIKNCLDEIESICEDRYQDIFISKNIPVWLSIFDKFKRLNMSDRFSLFLDKVRKELHTIEIDGLLWDDLDANKSTKDKSVIIGKINFISKLMENEFGRICDDTDELDVLDFVRENVSQDITSEDIDDYYSMLDEYDVDKRSNLMDWQNEPSLLAIIAYSFKNDLDLDDWIVDYFSRNSKYIHNQKENYIYMKKDLKRYIQQHKVAV